MDNPATAEVLARLGLGPSNGAALLHCSSDWTAVQASPGLVQCFFRSKLTAILRFPACLEALQLRRCIHTSSQWLVACSSTGHAWVLPLQQASEAYAGGGAANKRRGQREAPKRPPESSSAPAAEERAGGSEAGNVPGAVSSRLKVAKMLGGDSTTTVCTEREGAEGGAFGGVGGERLEQPTHQPGNTKHPPPSGTLWPGLHGEMLPVHCSYEPTALPQPIDVTFKEAVAVGSHRPGSLRPHPALTPQACWASRRCALARQREGQGGLRWASCLALQPPGACPQGHSCHCALLRAVVSHCQPELVTASLVVTTAISSLNRDDEDDGVGRCVVPGELFSALIAVTCDGLPPSYVLTGDSSGQVWAYSQPGSPLAPPGGAMVADLEQRIVAILPARRHSQRRPAAAAAAAASSSVTMPAIGGLHADAVLFLGCNGRAVLIGMNTTNEGGGRGGGLVQLREWRLHSGVILGATLVYAAAGRLFSASLPTDSGSPALPTAAAEGRGCGRLAGLAPQFTPKAVDCHERPFLLAASQRLGVEGSSCGSLVMLCASGALLSVPFPAESTPNPVAGSQQPANAVALHRQIQSLLGSLRDTEAIKRTLEDRIRRSQQHLAEASQSIPLLRESALAKLLRSPSRTATSTRGLTVQLSPIRPLLHAGPDGAVLLEVQAIITNSSQHRLVPPWQMLLDLAPCQSELPQGSSTWSCTTTLPLGGGLLPGQQSTHRVALLVADGCQGFATLRAHLLLPPPPPISSFPTDPVDKDKAGMAACCSTLAQVEVDIFNFLHRPYANISTASCREGSLANAFAADMEPLRLGVVQPGSSVLSTKAMLQHLLCSPAADPRYPGGGGGGGTTDVHSLQEDLPFAQGGIHGVLRLPAGRQCPPDGSAVSLDMRRLPPTATTVPGDSWELRATGSSTAALLQAHRAVLHRLLSHRSHSADYSDRDADLAWGVAPPIEQEEQLMEQLEALRTVERQMEALRVCDVAIRLPSFTVPLCHPLSP